MNTLLSTSDSQVHSRAGRRSAKAVHGLLASMFCILMVQVTLAQNPTQSLPGLAVLSGPAGNYVQLVQEDLPAVPAEGVYVIERATVDADQQLAELSYRRVGEMRAPRSAADLRQHLTEAQLKEFAEMLQLTDVDALVDWIRTHRAPADYGLFYELSEVRQAVGHLWLDDDVKFGQVYAYQIKAERKGPVLARGVGRAGTANIDLLQLQPRAAAPRSSDSTTTFTWYLTSADSVELTPPEKVSIFDEATAAWALPRATSFASLRGRIYVQENNDLRPVGLVVGTYTDSGDTMVFNHSYSSDPGTPLYAYLMLEDFIYNTGNLSDTVFAVQRSQANAQLVYWADSRDTTDAVAITWSPLSPRAELAGVRIVRVGEDERRDTLGIFAADAQPYLDRDLEVGIHYIYEVSAAFLPGSGLRQDAPATTVGTYVAFELPLPPHQVEARPEGENIRLEWQHGTSGSRFGYRIYRGTRPDKLYFAGGPVEGTTYLDTAAFLSGRSKYYYAIQAVNLRQDTSEYSKVVSARPNRAVDIPAPQINEPYVAAEALVLRWDDVRQRNNMVQGYRLERRLRDETDFQAVGPELHGSAMWRDTLGRGMLEGAQYRVASVGAYGGQSPFSDARVVANYTEDASSPAAVQNIFYLQPLAEGVAVSWPVTLTEDRVAYAIQRRSINDGSAFATISTVPVEEGYFLDGTATAAGLFEYGLGVVNAAGEVGEIGTKRTVRVR